MLALSEKGNNETVDMLVGDIYGSDYSKLGLKSTTIASTFGKVFKKQGGERGKFTPEDISKSLLYAISNNIGQIAYVLRFLLFPSPSAVLRCTCRASPWRALTTAIGRRSASCAALALMERGHAYLRSIASRRYMNAEKYNLDRIYFGGYFIRACAQCHRTLLHDSLRVRPIASTRRCAQGRTRALPRANLHPSVSGNGSTTRSEYLRTAARHHRTKGVASLDICVFDRPQSDRVAISTVVAFARAVLEAVVAADAPRRISAGAAWVWRTINGPEPNPDGPLLAPAAKFGGGVCTDTGDGTVTFFDGDGGGVCVVRNTFANLLEPLEPPVEPEQAVCGTRSARVRLIAILSPGTQVDWTLQGAVTNSTDRMVTN
ncbi:hypothetical protein NUW54_g7142 [Trametes sanguinea]|uniref:Uncharacterized protein n=1 Tax=Trametes sanguinea TaxID=158606 RepID=A0ACC1PRP7_9APHY|nr:hypothetical protein NUW54_g7142 [Trametes sanguinea]